MPVRKQDAHRALELLEDYRKKLTGPEHEELREAVTKAIIAIRSRLFQALLDIQEFYEITLDNPSKPVQVKTEETLGLVERWESHPPPVPVEATDLAAQTLDNTEGDWITERVALQRGETGGLGVSIAGGVDNPHMDKNDPGIYITKLIPNSPAENSGQLQLGDQILSVNDISLNSVSHAYAVQQLKDSGRNVALVVRRKQGRSWTPIFSDAGTLDRGANVTIERSVSPKGTDSPSSPSRCIDVVLVKNDKGLGFSIAGGEGNQHVLGDNGIFITKIIPGGPAEEEGTLSVGDRILQVNGNSMVDVRHDDAVSTLKSTNERVVLRIEKNAITDVQHGSTDEEAGIGDVQYHTVVLKRPEGTGLGFNIIGGEGDTGIFISFISPGSVADSCEDLNIGDQIIKVNGRDLLECSHEEAAVTLKGAGSAVTLVLQHRPKEYQQFQQRIQQLQEMQATSTEPTTPPGIKPSPVKQLYVRALFDHDSSKDDDCPSQGLSFKHGDILHILNGSDEEWWQAALVGNHADDGPQGLIPSKKRIERRNKANQKSVKFTRADSSAGDKDKKLSVSEKRGPRASFKLSKSLKLFKKKGISANAEDTEEPKEEEDHFPTYEPVTLEPRGYARPVIILGPLKEEINDSLVQEFPDKFAGCVPHTTRPPREGEVDGRDYHFVSSVEQMERDIQAHLFIEAGRYKENLYGTSIKAVKEVAEQGKHCILGVSGYAIRRLQMADLHPIAVCVRPSSVDVIQSNQPKNSEEQNRQIFDKGSRIEQEFAEFFTAIVEGDSLADIYSKVKNVIHEQSGNYIWVPSNENI